MQYSSLLLKLPQYSILYHIVKICLWAGCIDDYFTPIMQGNCEWVFRLHSINEWMVFRPRLCTKRLYWAGDNLGALDQRVACLLWLIYMTWPYNSSLKFCKICTWNSAGYVLEFLQDSYSKLCRICTWNYPGFVFEILQDLFSFYIKAIHLKWHVINLTFYDSQGFQKN